MSELREILHEGRVERLIRHEAKTSAVLGLETCPECNIPRECTCVTGALTDLSFPVPDYNIIIYKPLILVFCGRCTCAALVCAIVNIYKPLSMQSFNSVCKQCFVYI